MEEAHVNGIVLRYVDRGPRESVPVVFIHGFPFSHAMWDGQIDALSATYRCVAHDVRGLGQSDPADHQYTIEGHVDDLLGLLDRLGLDRVVCVGLSMGGYITLRALERAQERFLGAVLCDTRSEADTDEGKIRRFAGIRTVKSEGSRLFADTFVRAVFAPSSFETRPEAVAKIHGIISRTTPLSIAGTLLALASRTDTTASLTRITVPTMIIVGEEDTLTPPACSQAMHERIRGSELRIIPGAGHMTNLENPAAFNGALASFLRRISLTGTGGRPQGRAGNPGAA
jgi:pimeloyl-ACP methyl ester carboxylesterase